MNHTLGELLEAAGRRLRELTASPDSGVELDAQLLLAHLLRCSRSALLAHPQWQVSGAIAAAYRQLTARRAAGEPVAYLIGRREFWSLELEVTPAVLVPRPETELLVERALALLPGAAARVADLGTGSGAIALALASEQPHWHIVATDNSADALAVARRNARRLRLPGIEFRHGDWFAALLGEQFDLILSNPPYVAEEDPALQQLQYEPRVALSPGADALASLRVLVQGAPRHLRAGGWLVLEHGAAQGASVRHALVLAGFAHVRSHRDLAAHERVTEGQR